MIIHIPSRSFLASALLLLAVGCAKHTGVADVGPENGFPLFETRLEINTGTGTHADYHVADLNGDTFLDMAVISLSGELKILLGNGTSFVEGQLVQIDGSPIWIAGGDLDGDLDEDLVVVRASNLTADVYLNDGLATYSHHATLPIGTSALAVVVADVDLDGDQDIVLTRQVAPELKVFTNDGTANFALSNSPMLPGGGLAFNLAIGDVSRDGSPDYVVTDPENSRVVVFTPEPGQAMSYYVLEVPGNPRAASIGDVTGDGLADVAVSAFGTGEVVVITSIDFSGGSGSTAPYLAETVQLTAAPTLSTIGDVTGDGLADLVVCQEANASITVVPQLPGGGLGAYDQFDATGLPLRPFIADFNQDGRNDLAALSGLGDRINIWFGNPGDGRLLGARSYDGGLATAAFLGSADFDNDGDAEIAVGGYTSSQISIMERHTVDARPMYEPALVQDIGANVLQVETVDLDLDGRTDLLVSVAGGVKVLRNVTTAPGVYAFEVVPGLAVAISTASGPFGLAAADFDRDGLFDIAVCDYAGGAVHIVRGTSSPFVFGSEQVLPLAGRPTDLVAADFTGDGELDLAVSQNDIAAISILRNDGAGSFEETLVLPVGQAPNYLITGDFNRDAAADLVVSNGADGTISILFGGTTGFTGATYPAGQTPTALLAGDLTGDGIDDVLVTSLQSGDFRVLTGNGRGSFPTITTFPGTLGASDAELMDMDGDGLRDLLISSLITSRVSIVRNIQPGPIALAVLSR
ncbi:MAG: VCBS repeat-containing protein [Planctomycetes bacterium]|nr:VCBS repeat-containing protein [Planctomycetota bacterium]